MIPAVLHPNINSFPYGEPAIEKDMVYDIKTLSVQQPSYVILKFSYVILKLSYVILKLTQMIQFLRFPHLVTRRVAGQIEIPEFLIAVFDTQYFSRTLLQRHLLCFHI